MEILKENWEVIGSTSIIVAVLLLYMLLSQIVHIYYGSFFMITKREKVAKMLGTAVIVIVGTVVIVTVMMFIGIFISGRISNCLLNKFELEKKEYRQAAKIETKDLFDYGMQTNIGNAFVYGELEAINPVKFSELDGEYIYVMKIEELYVEHYHINPLFRTHSWKLGTVEKQICEQISFLGHVFPIDKINLPNVNDIYTIDYLNTKNSRIKHICTIQVSKDVRYKYYGIEAKNAGTIYTELKDGNISAQVPVLSVC